VTPLNIYAGEVHPSDFAGSLHPCNTDAETTISPTNANVLVTGLQAMPPHCGSRAACHGCPSMQGLSSSALRSMSAFSSPTSATSPVPPYPVEVPTTPIRQMIKSGASPRSVSTWSCDSQHTARFDAYAADVARNAAPQSPVSCFKLEYAHNVVTPAPGRPLRLKLSCTHNCD
jgi:hypothetical protein